jgi:hypothetical protein
MQVEVISAKPGGSGEMKALTSDIEEIVFVVSGDNSDFARIVLLGCHGRKFYMFCSYVKQFVHMVLNGLENGKTYCVRRRFVSNLCLVRSNQVCKNDHRKP